MYHLVRYLRLSRSDRHCIGQESVQHGENSCCVCQVDLITDEKTLCDRTAEKIVEGLVTGWFQGELETNPNAPPQKSPSTYKVFWIP